MSSKEAAIRDRLAARFVPAVEEVARHPLVVAGVVEANRTNHETEVEILAKDQLWRQASDADDAVIAPYLTNACALYLAETHRTRTGCSELFVMDAKGCIVAASVRTTDYWQGDEAKWTESYHGGVGKVFVDDIRYDHSSQAYVAQISVPVRTDEGKTIGAVTMSVLAQQDR